MASTRRKAAAVAIAIIGVAGLSLASAAQLTIGTASLGAGSVTIDAPCDGNGVGVSFTTAYNTTSNAYDASAVSITGIDTTNCAGQTLRVTVEDLTNGTVLVNDVTTTVDAATEAFDFVDVSAEVDLNVAVVIHS